MTLCLHNLQSVSSLHFVQPTPTSRDQAEQALGTDIGRWVHAHRTSSARLSYQQIANVLADETGVRVSREWVRRWHQQHVTAAA